MLRWISGHHPTTGVSRLCLSLLLVYHKASALLPSLSQFNNLFNHMFTSRYSHDGGNGGNWFLDGSVNALFVPDSDQLSSVGQLYNEL